VQHIITLSFLSTNWC